MAIEKFAPALDGIVDAGQEYEELGNGYALGEGPVYWKEGGYLLFSDVINNRRMKWTPGEGVTEFLKPSNYANGLTRDRQGRLIACEHGGATPEEYNSRVTRLEPDGSITVVANNYRGYKLNRPNDVVVRSDGSIYFTDLMTFNVVSELDFVGVYKVTPDLGTINLLVRGAPAPLSPANGLAFSPDEKVLYVTAGQYIRAFDMQAPRYGVDTGLLNLASERVFCDLRGERPGGSDGMKVDMEGNVYCGGSGGLWIIDPAGNHLGTITVPVVNMAWGGDDWRTLFFTTRETVNRIQLKIPGVPVPRGPIA
jgi:gluconolactonase